MAEHARSRPTAEDRIKAALWFAGIGFGIFTCWSTDDAGVCRCPLGKACTSPGKHPIAPNGFKSATTDPDRIRTMLSAGSEPNYGMLPPEGVFAWDVDEEDDGIAKLARLEALYGPLPDTLRTNTAHGQHVFLRWPDEMPRPLKKMFGYVTRWGTGSHQGYVIGPRSVHASGAVYAPAGHTLTIAELPERWVHAALEGETTTKFTVTGEELPDVGGRHDWLRDRARYFRGFMDSPETLRAALVAENARLPAPKTLEDVDRAIGDVFTKFPLDAAPEREERVSARLADDELGILSRPTTGGFPDEPSPIIFEGLLGSCLADIQSGTDASLVGLLGCLIAFCGALVPGMAYFHRIQTSSPYVALVGESSIGRKGTAMIRAYDAWADALDAVTVNRVILDGLNSGEGLVSALHYKHNAFPHEPTVGLVFEEEYASLLASRQREGSTLDPKLRQAFDGGPISNRRSAEAKVVSPPYWLPALIAITPDELRVRMEGGGLRSGSANRWIYLAVVKRDGTMVNDQPRFSHENAEAVKAAHRAAVAKPKTLTVAPIVSSRLAEYADFLPTVSFGISHDLVRRLSVIAFRVALVHALVERSDSVGPAHLERAIALTEYARAGIPWVFGETIGSPDADLLLRNLVAAGRLSKREITQQIIRDPIRRQAAVDELVRYGRAQVVTTHQPGAGRPRTELVATADQGGFRAFVQLRADYVQGVSISKEAFRANVQATDPSPLEDETLHGMHENPVIRTNDLARNLHEIGTNLHENPPELHETQTETVTCRDYKAHQSAHRFVDGGWVCTICRDEGEP